MWLRRLTPYIGNHAKTALRVLALPVALLVCGFAAVAASAPSGSSINPYYEHHSEGWFWYETMPEPAPADEPEKSAPAARETKAPPTTPDGPPPLSSAWLKVNLPKYLERATDEPTRENISAYYYLQRVALDKSNKFSDVAQEVVTQDYGLDEVSRRPLATYAVNEMNKVSGQTHDELLRQIAAKAGIVFVYHSECKYCAMQAPVLKNFANQYGFAITAISLDGLPMPGGAFPDYVTDSGQARELGVQQTPAMYLALPPHRTVELAQGVLSIDELSQRVAMASKQLGIVDEPSFDRARPVQAIPMVTDLHPSRETAADPEKLTEYIRNSVRLRH